MLVLQRIAGASATIARFGAVAALCWIGAELHSVAESARYVDQSPSRQAEALESIAAKLSAHEESELARNNGAEIVGALREVRDAINGQALTRR